MIRKIRLRLFIIILCSSLISLPSTGSANAQHAAPDQVDSVCGSDPSLVGCWQMEENGGASLIDGTSYVHNATIVGSPTWVTGKSGLAINLNGSTYAYVPDGADSHLNITQQVTLAAWIKPTTSADQYIIKKGNKNTHNGYELSLAAGNTFFFRINDNTTCRVDSKLLYNNYFNTWVHVAATYDQANLHIYVNGVLDDDASTPCTANIVTDATKVLAIGAQSNGNGKFSGAIDDIRIYNRVLSAGEILDLYTLPPLLPDSPNPENGASSVQINPVNAIVPLSANVRDGDSSSLTVSFYGRSYCQKPSFTVVALPDTQNYSQYYPNIFTSQTQWIVDNRDTSNIVFVTQEGDITNSGDGDPEQWVNASNAMYLLEGPTPEIPYSIAHGNHDAMGGTTQYNTYFGVSHFQGKSYYGGHYDTNNNTNYELFTAGGMDFIIVHIGYGGGNDTNVMSWVNTLIGSTYSNRRAIVTSHDVMNVDGTFTTQGLNIYNALKGNANLFLILCGHNHGENLRQDTYNGHTIYSVLADYQTEAMGGNGWLRLMEFQPSANQIQVSTYSPYLNQSDSDADSEFRLQYDMCPFQLISTVQNVTSGTRASVNWENRNENTRYEWFATVSDGTHTVTGPIWTFTTGIPTAVTLVDFNATSLPKGIQLDWLTAQEIDLVGFNIYRAETPDGPKVQINPQLIPALNPGQLQGNPYLYRDTAIEAGKRYYYWVEWIGTEGSELYGPIPASLSPYRVWLPIGLK